MARIKHHGRYTASYCALDRLLARGLVTTEDGETFTITASGREVARQHAQTEGRS